MVKMFKGLTPTATPLTATTTYKLQVVATNGCAAVKEIVVKVFTKLRMPTAFTPNRDGTNDLFRIPAGSLIQLQEFSVFDRSGIKVFSTTDLAKG